MYSGIADHYPTIFAMLINNMGLTIDGKFVPLLESELLEVVACEEFVIEWEQTSGWINGEYMNAVLLNGRIMLKLDPIYSAILYRARSL